MECLETLKGPSMIWLGKSLFSTTFKTRYANCLKFSLEDTTGWACLKSKVTVASTVYDLLFLLEDQAPAGQTTSHELLTKGGDNNFQVCTLNNLPQSLEV